MISHSVADCVSDFFLGGRYNIQMQKIGTTLIEDTYAEAFDVWVGSVVITAENRRWLNVAVAECTGYGTSVIGCDVEAGLGNYLDARQTMDGRGGARMMFFGFTKKKVVAAIQNRVGQAVMTCVGTRVFDGFEGDEKLGWASYGLGDYLKYFGDGFQRQERRFGVEGISIPVTAGVFFCESKGAVKRGIAGGNLLVFGKDRAACLAGVERGVLSVAGMTDVILPFPGGVVRCASKVGSKRYPRLTASTNDDYCPGLVGQGGGRFVGDGVGCVYEIVINGLSIESVRTGMSRMLQQIPGHGILRIGAANFGGQLGKHQIKLWGIAKRSKER